MSIQFLIFVSPVLFFLLWNVADGGGGGCDGGGGGGDYPAETCLSRAHRVPVTAPHWASEHLQMVMTISAETKRDITPLSQDDKKVGHSSNISYLFFILIFQQVNGEHDVDIQERNLVWSQILDIMIWIIATVKLVNL